MANTTNLWGSQGAGFSPCLELYGSQGAGFATAKQAWAWVDSLSTWEPRYSTPTVSCSGLSGSDSGPVGSGSVYSPNAAPSIGGFGFGPYSYAWTFVSGSSLNISNASISNPTWQQTVSAGSPLSAVWRVTVTDTATGATTTTTITISLSWTNTWVPFNQSFSNGQSGSLQVPAGSTQLILEIWGGGGDGGNGATGSNDHQGGGGGAGGYSKSIISISPSDWGQTINYSTGVNVVGSSTSGFITLTANPGNTGFTATPTTNGNGNTGGTASGGNTANVTGGTGQAGNTAGSGGAGAAPNNGGGVGGHGGFTNTNGGKTIGGPGQALFQWS